MKIWLATFLSVGVVSLISLIGVFFLALRKEKLVRIQLVLVAFATGGLLGGAFFHLLPESFESFDNKQIASLLIVIGFILFFVLERFLHWHHNHGVSENNIEPFGVLNLVADIFHNLLDGLLIGAAYTYSPAIGVATTLTVLMHELPQEIGDFGVLIHAGFTRRKALFFNFLSACTAFLGAALVLLLGENTDAVAKAVLPLAAGGFIYLAAADLIPELHTEKAMKRSIFQFLALIAGMAVLFIILLITE